MWFRQCSLYLSLVAEEGSHIVGRILFTPAIISAETRRIEAMGLAPLAVVPDHQRKGIGTRLVRREIVLLKQRSCPVIIVPGSPGILPKFQLRTGLPAWYRMPVAGCAG